MKVWITTDDYEHKDFVRIHVKRPVHGSHWDETEQCYITDSEALACRHSVKSLLRGSGKTLPKHGSKEIVEIELTAK